SVACQDRTGGFSMSDDFMGFDQPKRKVGRPRGSKNRDALSIETQDRVETIFKRMKPFMTREQMEYAEEIQNGRAGVDAVAEMELVIRQVTFVFSEVADEMWRSKRVTKEFTELINALRMSLKDFEDMKTARDAKAERSEKIEIVGLETR